MGTESMANAQAPPFGHFKRLVTYHAAGSEDDKEPAVSVALLPMDLPRDDKLGVFAGSAWMTHGSSAHNTFDLGNDTGVEGATVIVNPGGTNCRVTVVEPNGYVGMHRTNSVDYNVITHGSVKLITPINNGKELQETAVSQGDIVVQRGTLHAWKAGPEGARWVTTIVEADPVVVQRSEGRSEPLEEILL